MTSGHGNRTHLPPEPGRVYGIMRVPFMTAPTKDGRFIQMCSRQPRHYRRWLAELGLEGLLDDPELANAPDLWPSEERLAGAIEAIQAGMAERTAAEWMEVFSAKDIGGDPFLAPREFLDHPQCTENGRRQEVDDPELGPTVQIGPAGAVFRHAVGSRVACSSPRRAHQGSAGRLAVGPIPERPGCPSCFPRRPPPGRCDHPGCRLLLRVSVRGHAAGRSGGSGDQGRAARR